MGHCLYSFPSAYASYLLIARQGPALPWLICGPESHWITLVSLGVFFPSLPFFLPLFYDMISYFHYYFLFGLPCPVCFSNCHFFLTIRSCFGTLPFSSPLECAWILTIWFHRGAWIYTRDCFIDPEEQCHMINDVSVPQTGRACFTRDAPFWPGPASAQRYLLRYLVSINRPEAIPVARFLQDMVLF